MDLWPMPHGPCLTGPWPTPYGAGFASSRLDSTMGQCERAGWICWWVTGWTGGLVGPKVDWWANGCGGGRGGGGGGGGGDGGGGASVCASLSLSLSLSLFLSLSLSRSIDRSIDRSIECARDRVHLARLLRGITVRILGEPARLSIRGTARPTPSDPQNTRHVC